VLGYDFEKMQNKIQVKAGDGVTRANSDTGSPCRGQEGGLLLLGRHGPRGAVVGLGSA